MDKIKLRTKTDFYRLVGKYLELGFSQKEAVRKTEKELLKKV